MIQKKDKDLTVACYTFPGFHPAALNKRTYGTDWDEYSLIRAGRPWYPGHNQPKQPTLGELDESKPETWEIYNNLASAHGIDVFIHDWYWWQGGPALHEALEEGFLKSSNCDKMKFAVMWTNHGWGQFAETMRTDGSYYWPPVASDPSKSSEDIYRSFAYIISRYMHLPNYWRIDGKPVLVVFQPTWLDSDERSGEMVEEIRILAKKMGHPEIHLHASFGGMYNKNLTKMGYDSYGHYNPVDEVGHKHRHETEEIVDYSDIVNDILEKFLDQWNSLHELPFFPAIAPGFDWTPRHTPRKRPEGEKPHRYRWPGCLVVENDTPAEFKRLVEGTVDFINKKSLNPKIMEIGCWNEWSEGCYLLPDLTYGYGKLKALAEGLGVNPDLAKGVGINPFIGISSH